MVTTHPAPPYVKLAITTMVQVICYLCTNHSMKYSVPLVDHSIHSSGYACDGERRLDLAINDFGVACLNPKCNFTYLNHCM